MKPKRPAFEQACRCYVHRFTCEHVPEWATRPRADGTYYAPQYRSDREWYEHTRFPGEPGHIMGATHCGYCDSRGQTFLLGETLRYRPDPFILREALETAEAVSGLA